MAAVLPVSGEEAALSISEEEAAALSREEMQAKAAAVAAEMMDAVQDFRRSLQFLNFSYPPLPPKVLCVHVRRNFVRPSPLLEKLCPPAGYTVQPWHPTITDWPYESISSPVNKNFLVPFHSAFLMGHDIVEPLGCRFLDLDSGGICRPEGAVVDRHKVLVVVVVDVLRLPPALDVVLNRMFHYLEMTGAKFGAVTCYSSTWLCKREDAVGRAPVLRVSCPEDRPAMAIGFLVHEARKEPSLQPRIHVTYPLIDMNPALGLLKQVCDHLKVGHKDKILGEADVRGSFKVDELDDVKFLSGICEQSDHLLGVKVRTVMKALYRGQRVVVKTRDITSTYKIGLQGSLERFVREVNAHLSLKNIQGEYVPKLLSWGFLRGAMFLYTITTDVGRDNNQVVKDGDQMEVLGNAERRAAIPTTLKVLGEIHRRGVLHGDIGESKVVMEQDEAGQWRVMLVGFAQSSRLVVFSEEWLEATRKEIIELDKVIDRLVRESTWMEDVKKSREENINSESAWKKWKRENNYDEWYRKQSLIEIPQKK